MEEDDPSVYILKPLLLRFTSKRKRKTYEFSILYYENAIDTLEDVYKLDTL